MTFVNELDYMSLKDINIKQSYDSDKDKPLHDFYIPVLSVATSYKRITGSFSSGILAKAALGIAGLVKNGGKMQLLAGVEISERDFDAMKEAVSSPEKFINDLMEKEIGDIEVFLYNNFVEALAWMLANDLLEIKIGVVPPGNLSHMKVGIIEDADGNCLSFSGSNNETPSGWEHNIEEFKVFRGWKEEERPYFDSDAAKFSDLWEGRGKRIKVFDLPKAITEKIIRAVHKRGIPKLLTESVPKTPYLDSLSYIHRERYLKLYEHQKSALSAWINNGGKGILEMATGTGKTLTALAGISKYIEEGKIKVCIIAAPQTHLISQWLKEFKKAQEYGQEEFKGLQLVKESNIFEVPGQLTNWKKTLANVFSDIRMNLNNGPIVIVTSHKTLSSPDFLKLFSEINFEILLVADETHGLGSTEQRKGLHDSFTFRLGLSATPICQYDEEGTGLISDFFGGTVYEFPISRAITEINPATGQTFLTPYLYNPVFCRLTEDEMEEYLKLSKQIGRYYRPNEVEQSASFQQLVLKRANIKKNAIEKIDKLEEIIRSIEKDKRSHMFVYCHQTDQLILAEDRLKKLGMIPQRFTGDEDTKPDPNFSGMSQREHILNLFKEGKFNVLVAMKILDEGVDVPSAHTAILLANSTSRREFIQRRGRVLRRFPGKEIANIYDMIVLPPKTESGNVAYDEKERKVVIREFERYYEFADIAKNASDCRSKIISVKRELGIL